MKLDAVTARVRAEFDEMPGLTLTMPQASRLFGLEPDLCHQVVQYLIACSYLRLSRGRVILRREG